MYSRELVNEVLNKNINSIKNKGINITAMRFDKNDENIIIQIYNNDGELVRTNNLYELECIAYLNGINDALKLK
jgi:archaellum component FlaF (FlaF/FlaG flagellin family)